VIAKIVKGNSFAGVIKYILDPKKNTELLGSEGVRTNNIENIIKSFETQQQLNLKITKPVGHISLDFSAKDKDKLSNDLMLKIAHEYMDKMGIVDTQYIVGRHYDKEHPHIHIAFNRISYNVKTISDKNDRFRSEKICKELTAKYGLYFAKGKENVKEHRLKEPDKTKYEIYHILKFLVTKSKNWNELVSKLNNEGVKVEFKKKGKSDEIEGVRFLKNNYRFNGSKIDRAFSYSKIDYQLKQNSKQAYDLDKSSSNHLTSEHVTSLNDEAINSSGIIDSMLNLMTDANPGIDGEEDAFRRLINKRKKKKGRRL